MFDKGGKPEYYVKFFFWNYIFFNDYLVEIFGEISVYYQKRKQMYEHPTAST